MSAVVSAANIVGELRAAKARWFDRFIDGLCDHRLDAVIGDLVVPHAEWSKGFFAEPVRWSVCTPQDSALKGRFFATVQFDLSKRKPNVQVAVGVQLPDGSFRHFAEVAEVREFETWEVCVMEARWTVQFLIAEAEERLGLRGGKVSATTPTLSSGATHKVVNLR